MVVELPTPATEANIYRRVREVMKAHPVQSVRIHRVGRINEVMNSRTDDGFTGKHCLGEWSISWPCDGNYYLMGGLEVAGDKVRMEIVSNHHHSGTDHHQVWLVHRSGEGSHGAGDYVRVVSDEAGMRLLPL